VHPSAPAAFAHGGGVEADDVAFLVHARATIESCSISKPPVRARGRRLRVVDVAVDRDRRVALLLGEEIRIDVGVHEGTRLPLDVGAGRLRWEGRQRLAFAARNAPSSWIVLISGAGKTTVEFLSTAISTRSAGCAAVARADGHHHVGGVGELAGGERFALGGDDLRALLALSFGLAAIARFIVSAAECPSARRS